jgi:hypothetical protein
MGLDPARHRLHPAMPRYRLSLRDADDLVAYLARVGSDADPGLTATELSLGVTVPPTVEGKVIRETIAGWFDEVNARGGIYGRRVKVDGDGEPFAIVFAQPGAGDAESNAETNAEAKAIPTIAPFRVATGDANRYLFALVAGVEEQARALIDAAGTKVRIVSDARTADVAEHLAPSSDPASGTVLFLSSADEFAALLKARTADTILIPAAFAGPAVRSAPGSTRVLVAMPAGDVSPRATALAAAKLLTRALERAGRDIDRESLVDVLDSFRREPTGLIPPVTWTATRRVGSTECAIARVTERGLEKIP